MAKSIGSLYVELSVKNGMSKVLSQANKDLGKFGTSAIKWGAVAAGAIAAGMVVGTKRALEQVDALDDLSTSTGVAVSDLMALQRAYKEGGLSADQASKDIGKMQNAIFDASTGGGKADTFARLGIDIKAILAMSPAKQFETIGTAIMGVKNMAEKVASAREIFGKSGSGLLSAFDGIVEARSSLGSMPKLAEQFADEMARANDLVGRMPGKFDQFFVGFTAGVVGELLPALEDIDELDFADIGKAFGDDVAPAIRQMADAIAATDFKGLASDLSAVANAAVSVAQGYSKIIDMAIKLPNFRAVEAMGFAWNQSDPMNKLTTPNQDQSWAKIAGAGQSSPAVDGFAASEAKYYADRAATEAAAATAKAFTDEMMFVAPAVRSLVDGFSPEMLLRGYDKGAIPSDTGTAQGDSNKREVDELLKRGLVVGNMSTPRDREDKKQTSIQQKILAKMENKLPPLLQEAIF